MTAVAASTDPRQQLADMAAHAKQRAQVAAPQQQKEGIIFFTFGLLGQSFLISMKAVVEIVARPSIAPMPMVQPWARGSVSVRGNAMMVIDLPRFLDMRSTEDAKWVLVLRCADMHIGMLVERAYGLHQLQQDTVKDGLEGVNCPEPIKSCVDGHIEIDGQLWLRFDPQMLLADPRIQNVSIM